MPTWLLGLKGLGIAVCAAALLSCASTWYIVGLSYRITIANMERDAADNVAAGYKGALDQFRADAGTIHDAAAGYAAEVSYFNARLDSATKDFQDAIKAHPLSSACVLDAGRLRALTAAISATNPASGSGSGPAVPTHP
jgi:hypothetical protein